MENMPCLSKQLPILGGLNEGFGFLGWSFVKVPPAGVRCVLESEDHLTPVDRVKRWLNGVKGSVQQSNIYTHPQTLSY